MRNPDGESDLPRTAWLDEQGLHIDPAEPFANRTGGELGTIVGTNVVERPAVSEQIGE
jgi:hypothetical protein